MLNLDADKISAQSPLVARVRWRVMQWVFTIASIGMVPLILSGKDYQWSSIGSLVLLSAGFALLAIIQGILKTASPRLESTGLILGVIVFVARFMRIVTDVVAQDLPPEALADIFPWAAVIYTSIFLIFKTRVALLTAISLWLLISLFTLVVLARATVVRGFEPSIDLIVSSLVMILMLSVFRNLVELGVKAQARAEAMSELAIRDSLTELYNRRYFDGKLAEEFIRSSRYTHPLSVAMCDIDYFKAINDLFSHEVGDQTLKTIASLLQNNIRKTDILARYGGEEFVIAFPETTRDEAIAICQKLCETVANHDWHSVHTNLKVTVSIGLCDDLSLSNHEKLLHAADLKLYQAKQQGKNQVCY